MPLTALLGAALVQAPFLGDDAWASVVGRARGRPSPLRMRCCEAPAFTRVSSRGTRHFVHYRKGDCATGPESWQHLLVKEVIARAARDAGWSVDVEARGNGWVADVLCREGSRSVAFEVQHSPQTAAQTKARHGVYQAAGIEAVWLLRRPHCVDGVPVARLVVGERKEIDVALHEEWRYSSEQVAIGLFVRDFLAHGLHFRREVFLRNPGTLLVEHVEYPCYKCGYDGLALRLADVPSCCGSKHHISGLWPQERGQILARAQQQGRFIRGRSFIIKRRYTRSAGQTYWVNCCPRCDSPQGDWYVNHEHKLDERPQKFTSAYALPCSDGEIGVLALFEREDTEPVPALGDWHWCRADVSVENLGWVPETLAANQTAVDTFDRRR